MSENEGQDLPLAVTTALTASGLMAAKAILGPTFNEIGEDLRKLYAVGRDKIIDAAYRKLSDPNDGKKANLRVVRDTLWNGAFSDDEICAEYFGGVLAGSRSEDGRDDTNIQFVSTIKSMSSSQLRLHYFVYARLNQLLVQSNKRVNVADSTQIQSKKVFFLTGEISDLNVQIETDLVALLQRGLVHGFRYESKEVDKLQIPYFYVQPNTSGVVLFAVAHAKLRHWRLFDQEKFPPFEGVRLPKYFASTLEELANCRTSG